MKTSSISLTKHYFALSNQADLTAIRALLHPEATYSSAHTGLYFGVHDIMQMMQAYFAAHQSINWQLDRIESRSDHITEVHFSCEAVDLNGIKQKRKTGVERLVVVEGLIRHIEVR